MPSILISSLNEGDFFPGQNFDQPLADLGVRELFSYHESSLAIVIFDIGVSSTVIESLDWDETFSLVFPIEFFQSYVERCGAIDILRVDLSS